MVKLAVNKDNKENKEKGSASDDIPTNNNIAKIIIFRERKN
jgi:hypothetical protein